MWLVNYLGASIKALMFDVSVTEPVVHHRACSYFQQL